MSEKKNGFLDEPRMGIGSARGLLARLFRLILWEINFNGLKWNQHMDAYLDDPRHGIPPNVKERSTAKGNLNKELKHDTMTWRVFFEKALPFLNPLKVRFTVQLTWRTGKVTSHSIELHMRDAPLEEQPEENDLDPPGQGPLDSPQQ